MCVERFCQELKYILRSIKVYYSPSLREMIPDPDATQYNT